MKIDLPWLEQERDYSCLPACIRIVLLHYGVDLKESEICFACGTTPRGTGQAEAASGIVSLGFRAIKLKNSNLDNVIHFLGLNQPVIVIIGSAHLPYGGKSGTHAVVINGASENQVSFVDPARGEEIEISSETFQRAWKARRCLGLVIESL